MRRYCPPDSIEKLVGALVGAQSILGLYQIHAVQCADLPAPTFTNNTDFPLEFEGIKNRDWL